MKTRTELASKYIRAFLRKQGIPSTAGGRNDLVFHAFALADALLAAAGPQPAQEPAGDVIRAWVTRDGAGPCELHAERPEPRDDEHGYTWPGGWARNEVAKMCFGDAPGGPDAIAEIEIRRVGK